MVYRAIIFWGCIIVAVFTFASCDQTPYEVEYLDGFSLHITKWYNNHTAAISITNDAGAPHVLQEQKVQEEILKRNLTMDYELVTYNLRDEVREYFIDYLIPNGFGVFGHGHKHINHDELSYEEAYDSFKKNYELMVEMGMTPISYAYPTGGGWRESTQRALADAGFLSGRNHRTRYHDRVNIVPGNTMAPDNWYYLPTLVMQDYNFAQNEEAINNCAELIPYLDDALDNTAWLIKTYHAIGNESGWGFFDWDEFIKALDEIKSRDFWSVSMDNATRYIKQRKTARVDLYDTSDDDIYSLDMELLLDIDPELFCHPMTVKVEFPERLLNKKYGLYKNEELKKEFTVTSDGHYFDLIPFESYSIVELYAE